MGIMPSTPGILRKRKKNNAQNGATTFYMTFKSSRQDSNGAKCEHAFAKGIGMDIFYEPQEPDGESLEAEFDRYIKKIAPTSIISGKIDLRDMAHHFANWQKQQMMKNIIAEQDCTCIRVLHRIIGGSWNLSCPLDKLNLGSGDKVKLIIIKKD